MVRCSCAHGFCNWDSELRQAKKTLHVALRGAGNDTGLALFADHVPARVLSPETESDFQPIENSVCVLNACMCSVKSGPPVEYGPPPKENPNFNLKYTNLGPNFPKP